MQLTAIPLVRAAVLMPIVAFLDRHGMPTERLLARAGLQRGSLREPEALIVLEQACRFMEECARAEGVRNFGLIVGQELSVGDVGLLGKIVRHAPTLGAAVSVLQRFASSFNSGVQHVITCEGDSVHWQRRFLAPELARYRQHDGYGLMFMLRVLQIAAGPGWKPAEVQFASRDAGDLSDVPLLTGTRITFDRPVTGVTFPRSLLARPLSRSVASVEVSEADLQVWRESAPAADFPGSVQQVITASWWQDTLRLERVAAAVGMSVRSLQRRLREAGVRYDALVARSRLSTAAERLQRTTARVVDIALDLGYSDHAHFTRAFRRWTGTTPREFRRRVSVSDEVSGRGQVPG